MGDGGMIHCERCGKKVPLSPVGAAQYCLGCRLFLCGGCHDGISVRCSECQGSTATGLDTAAGITAARDAMRALRQASKDLGRLRAPAEERYGTAAIADRRDEAALAQVQAVSAVRSSEYALAHVGPRFARRAEGIRQELALVSARIRLLSEETDVSSPASRAIIGVRRLLTAGSRRMRDAQPTVLVAAVIFVASVGLVLTVSLRPTPGPQAAETVATVPTAREGIAGSNPDSSGSPTPVPLSSTPPAPFRADHQFDDLAMGAALDAGWSVSGSKDDVVVAAYPTAIDRSLQMRRSPQGLRLCRVGAPGSGASSAAVDFRFDLAVPPDARLLHLRAATGDVELATTDESTLVLNIPGHSTTVTRVEPMTWYRVMLQAGDGTLLFSLLDPESGAELSRSSVNLDVELTAEAVCFELPAGAAGDLYIDDLVITA